MIKLKEFGIIKSAFDNIEMTHLQKTCYDILNTILLRSNLGDLSSFSEEVFHEKFIQTASVHPEIITQVINTFMNTAAFNNFLSSTKMQKLIAREIFSNEHLDGMIITEQNFRIDLPSNFTEEEKKYSLGWHQESSYFTKNVSHSNGFVVWIPLFDVSRIQGAMKIIPNSSGEGPIKHNYEYKDKKHKKNLRAIIPIDILREYESKEVCLELNKGDMAFFNFNTFHSGGLNNDLNYVRCTFQARIASFLDSSFIF